MGLHKQIRQIRAINDHKAKQLLKRYDIPLVTEKFVRRSLDVLSTAKSIGFPLVIKGIGQHSFKAIFYSTPERAVKSFAKMAEYYRFLNR